MIQSKDDGQNWSPPAWIEVQRNPSGWTGFPDNAVHGIQLSAGQHAGRLVIPAKVFKQGERGFLTGICGGLLTSDDRGRTWTVGAVLQPGSDESVIAETSGGGVSVNYRYNKWFNEKRGFGHSVDGGATIQDFGNHEDLVTPTCHAGLVRVPDWDDQGDALLFSHPGYPRAGRNDMSVYLSCDQGHTWFYTQLIHEGPSAYSDLLLAPDGSILCLFENAPRRFSDYGNNALFWGQISVTRFDRAWLTENLRTVRASLPKEDDESEKVSGTFFKKVPDTFFLKTHTNEI